jgi:hypothetical protein
MRKLSKEIPVLVCKMEKVFPPGFHEYNATLVSAFAL